MPRIAIYNRVSTTDQHPEIQLDALRTYVEARSLEVAEVYVDVGGHDQALLNPSSASVKPPATGCGVRGRNP